MDLGDLKVTEHLKNTEIYKSQIWYISVHIKNLSHQYFIVSLQQCYTIPTKFIPNTWGGDIDATFSSHFEIYGYRTIINLYINCNTKTLPNSLISCNIGQAWWYMSGIPLINYELEDSPGYVVRPCHHKQITYVRTLWGQKQLCKDISRDVYETGRWTAWKLTEAAGTLGICRALYKWRPFW